MNAPNFVTIQLPKEVPQSFLGCWPAHDYAVAVALTPGGVEVCNVQIEYRRADKVVTALLEFFTSIIDKYQTGLGAIVTLLPGCDRWYFVRNAVVGQIAVAYDTLAIPYVHIIRERLRSWLWQVSPPAETAGDYYALYRDRTQARVEDVVRCLWPAEADDLFQKAGRAYAIVMAFAAAQMVRAWANAANQLYLSWPEGYELGFDLWWASLDKKYEHTVNRRRRALGLPEVEFERPRRPQRTSWIHKNS